MARNDCTTIHTSKVFEDLVANRDAPRILLVGSTRSTKTWSLCQYVIMRMKESKIDVNVYRNDASKCFDNVGKDFIEILSTQFRDYKKDSMNMTVKKYTMDNGSTISFKGTNDLENLHGIRQDIAWLNECNHISYEAFVQIRNRTKGQILFDMNPTDANTWALTKVKNAENPPCVYLHSTYKDNPFLPPEQIASIESLDPSKPENVKAGTADRYRWEVYGLGLPSARENIVIPANKWRVVDNSDFPKDEDCYKVMYGLDFGFSADPTALIKIQIYNQQVWLTELIYEKNLQVATSGVGNSTSLLDRLKTLGVRKTDLIIADGSRPESIYTICEAGYTCLKCADKSIEGGISAMMNYYYNVNGRSVNLQHELINYVYGTSNSTGEQNRKPIDKDNHLMDALRYVMITLFKGNPLDNDKLSRGNRNRTVTILERINPNRNKRV